MGVMNALRRRFGHADDQVEQRPKRATYIGPNAAVVLPFIRSLYDLSAKEWRKVGEAAAKHPGWDAWNIVDQTSKESGRYESGAAAAIAEHALLEAGDPWDGPYDDNARAAGEAVTGAAAALVVRDLVPESVVAELLAPFRGTAAVLPIR